MKKITLSLLLLSQLAHAQVITSIAGDGTITYADHVPATTTGMPYATCVRTDASGNVYVSELSPRSMVRRVGPDGNVVTIAGYGSADHMGDGNAAVAARILDPTSIATDRSGNVYIAESAKGGDLHDGPWIRKVDASGIITTIAGTVTGFSGDGGPATLASFLNIGDIATDVAGNLYMLDNSRVRKIDAAGIVTTIAGIDGSGSGAGAGDGGPATAADLGYPSGIAIDADNNIFIACISSIRRIDGSTGIITTIAGGGGSPADGVPATTAAIAANTLAVDPAGNIYFCDRGHFKVRRVSAAGIINTIAGNGASGYSGDGGPATAAQVGVQFGIATDDLGNVYIADYGSSRVRKICMACEPSLVAAPVLKQVSIHPNPAGTRVFIDAPYYIERITMINAAGQIVFTGAPEGRTAVVSVTSFPAGCYFLRLNDAPAGTFTKE